MTDFPYRTDRSLSRAQLHLARPRVEDYVLDRLYAEFKEHVWPTAVSDPVTLLERIAVASVIAARAEGLTIDQWQNDALYRARCDVRSRSPAPSQFAQTGM